MDAWLAESIDYRQFIDRALILRGKTRRDLAAAIGRSESWVSYLISGARNMDPELVDDIAAFLELGAEAEAFFAALVDVDSRSKRAQRAAQATIDALRRQKLIESIGRQYSAAFSRWYVPAILELARCDGFRDDAAWIAGTLSPCISEADARAAVDELLALGLLVRRDGTLGPGVPESWSPSDLPRGDVANAAAASLHRATLGLAAESLATHRQNERHVSSVVLALSEDQYPTLVARLREIERELVLRMSEEGAPVQANRVYALGFHLFPVSEYSDTEVEPQRLTG